jgi:hypothetical protein
MEKRPGKGKEPREARQNFDLLLKAAEASMNNEGVDLTNMTREERRKALFGDDDGYLQ